MTTVFLSYSTKDFFFADLAEIKLKEADIRLWRDQGHLVTGEDWRSGIERGLSESAAVVVALSPNSAQSSYVTYEWAYAMGRGKPIIPLKLEECQIHPRLEAIQYLDFSNRAAQPWQSLIERIRQIAGPALERANRDDVASRAIHGYLQGLHSERTPGEMSTPTGQL